MEGGDRESADGETLSGKAGVIPRAIKQIFDTLRGKTDYTVKVSFLELYNEEITDLLAVGEDENKKLPIRDDGERRRGSAARQCWPCAVECVASPGHGKQS